MDKHHKNKKTEFLAEVKQCLDINGMALMKDCNRTVLEFINSAYELGHDAGYSDGHNDAENSHYDW